MEEVDGNEWINGTILWKVTYEFADDSGGGEAVDYFKTMNRDTPPTGPQIRKALDSVELTVIGVEAIEWFTTDTPEEHPSLEAGAPDDARHDRVYDLLSDDPDSHSGYPDVETL
jgi:hypothetical protein